jgi:hypothetical protein
MFIGTTEAINGNIKTLLRRGRGYKNLGYLLLLKAQRMAVTKTEFIVLQKPPKMRVSTNSCSEPKKSYEDIWPGGTVVVQNLKGRRQGNSSAEPKTLDLPGRRATRPRLLRDGKTASRGKRHLGVLTYFSLAEGNVVSTFQTRQGQIRRRSHRALGASHMARVLELDTQCPSLHPSWNHEFLTRLHLISPVLLLVAARWCRLLAQI